MNYIITFFFALTLASCSSSPPTQFQIQAADIGIAPSQSQAEAIAGDFLQRTLKDPQSAQKQFGQVERGYYTKALIEGGGSKIAWRLPAQVNAKNSFGGYTGFKAYYFFIAHSKLVAVGYPEVMYLSSGPMNYMSVLEFDGGGVDPPEEEDQ